MHHQLESWIGKTFSPEAAAFLMRVARLVRLADDLVDGDIAPADRPQAMSDLAYMFLLQLPSLPFYVQWQGSLAPLLATCFATWAQTDRAKTSPHETIRIWGYVWRDSIDFVLFQTALLDCGPLLAQQIIAEWIELEHGGGAETLSQWEQSSDGPLRQASEAT